MANNLIKPKEHGVDVTLDPTFILSHAAYMPDGETIIKSNMTIGQLIEAIAYAHIKAKLPNLEDRCKLAKIEFVDGKFHIAFADSLEALSF